MSDKTIKYEAVINDALSLATYSLEKRLEGIGSVYELSYSGVHISHFDGC